MLDCGDGLFVDQLTRKCVYCTEPCNTCEITPTTCLSCLTGLLYQSQCISSCPAAHFNQSGTCILCPNKCASCLSLTECYSCTAPYLLYHNFCISECPSSHAVIINLECTRCSDSFCTSCKTTTEFKYLRVVSVSAPICVSSCPAGYYPDTGATPILCTACVSPCVTCSN